MRAENRIVAVGLLTERDLAMLGEGFKLHYPLTGAGDFTPLLAAMDAADRQYRNGSASGGQNEPAP